MRILRFLFVIKSAHQLLNNLFLCFFPHSRIATITSSSDLPYSVRTYSIITGEESYTPYVKAHDQLTYPVPDDVGIGWISSRDVATLIVVALEKPSLAGSSFLISGLQNLKGPELAQEFSVALKRTISYKAMLPEKFGKILDTAFGAGAGDKAAQEYQKMWDTKQFPPTHFDMTKVLEKLPVKMTSLADWAKMHTQVFTKA